MITDDNLRSIENMFDDFKSSLNKLSQKNKISDYFYFKDKFSELVNYTKESTKAKSKQRAWCSICNKNVPIEHGDILYHPMFFGEDVKRAKEVYKCRTSKTKKCTCGAHTSKIMALK